MTSIFIIQNMEEATDDFQFIKSISVNISIELSNVSIQSNISFVHLCNETQTNSSLKEEGGFVNLAKVVVISLILTLLIATTILGNVFVIVAIIHDKNLCRLGNGLVLSLAVADLMVACLVMPLGAVYEVSEEWPLGPELCDVWTSCDVLCCTASILHLLAIAVDRYWAVTCVDYVRQRNLRHVCAMIIIIWGVAFMVSFPPVFGWKDPESRKRVEVEKRCMVSQDVAYQIFATCSTFYLPLIAIFVLYGRIYRVARKRIRNKPGGRRPVVPGEKAMTLMPPPIMAEVSVISDASFCPSSYEPSCNGASSKANKEKRQKRKAIEHRREKKTAKTLAIITGVFVMCWLPFFVIALMMPLCPSCQPDDYIFSVFLWLGYANSMVNPIIYTIFSPDFRIAFKRMLSKKTYPVR